MTPNLKSPLPPSPVPRPLSPPRGSRPRKGVVLLIVISLLALFVLLGVTYTLAVSQYSRAANLNVKVQQVGDPPHIEADLILGQILYDTSARTVLQYQGLLRDLYGYDANIVSNTTTVIGGHYPQFRETVQGNVSAITGGAAPYLNGLSGGNQFFTFAFTLPLPNPIPASPPNLTALSAIPNYYGGRVITFQSGVCANHSARIVAYNPIRPIADLTSTIPASGQLTIEMIESKLAGTVSPQVSDQFIINGSPFNGTGSGYFYDASAPANPINHGVNNTYAAPDPATAGSRLPAFPVSLLPNPGAYDTALGTFLNNLNPYDFGGLDESWDAPDLQNMFLAMVPPSAAAAYASGTNPTIIPSFHRPELINFWNTQLQAATDARDFSAATTLNQAQRDFLRTINFRPMPWDHPNFSGSNPAFATTDIQTLLRALRGQNAAGTATPAVWDVDNDNDGVPDSIWIDPGLPVVTTPDGRRYRRLASILIKDLDGSLNINAHGNLAQVQVPGGLGDNRYRAEYQPQVATQPMLPGYTPPPAGANPYPYALGLTPVLASVPGGANFFIPRGMGFGPAEVDFLKIFASASPAYNDANAVTAYTNLLRARYVSNVFVAGSTNPDSGNFAVPGQPTPANPTGTAYDYRDPLAAIKHAGIPNDYGYLNSSVPFAQWLAQPSWYASPPDVWGRGAVVLDVGGQPLFAYMGQPPVGTIPGEVVDSPYEICLSGENSNTDTPYTVAELERILRYHDPDAPQLPQRILNTTFINPTTNPLGGQPGFIDIAHTRRNMLTTLSSDIPVPATTIPPELRALLATNLAKIPGSSSILDLYSYKLQASGVTGPQLTNELHKIVPWEFFKGQKFDINRPFGDGVDNNGDNARDDPFESNSGEFAWQGSATVLPNMPTAFRNIYSQNTNTVNFVDGGPPRGTRPNDNLFARQLYARHLFCLAMLFIPDNFQADLSPADSALPVSSNPVPFQRPVNRWLIRRIAQWAINCADYKDSDSIMTPFEFDYNPWDGWNVDGRLETDGVTVPETILINGTNTNFTWAANETQRGVVWGMESPDLLITETIALHDRRVKDTDQDNGTGPDGHKKIGDSTAPADEDLDQFRIPQGSLFVELYCPRPMRTAAGELRNNKPRLPFELYDITTGQLRLDLLAPASGGTQWPVWRLAMSRIATTVPDQVTHHPTSVAQLGGLPETASFDGIHYSDASGNWRMNMSTIPGTNAPLQIDRFAYLGSAARLPPNEQGRSFYNVGSALLTPGQYAVVGPRPQTNLGSLSNDPTDATRLWGGNSPQRIQLSPFAVYDRSNTSTQAMRAAGFDMQPPLSVICAIPQLNPVTNAPLVATSQGGADWQPPWAIGMNVTEPLPFGTIITPRTNYYQEPSYPTYPTPPTGATYPDFYDDPNAANRHFKDVPAEGTTNTANGPGRPIFDNSMNHTGTYHDYSSVFLQRLANPLRPYNPFPNDSSGTPDAYHNPTLAINPYITVDWQTIDVNVFSGEEDSNQPVPIITPPLSRTYFDPDDNPTANPRLRFRSRQRGYVAAGPSSTFKATSNPWPPFTAYSWPSATPYVNLAATPFPATPTPYLTAGTPYFLRDLSDTKSDSYTYNGGGTSPYDCHTLGYLNSTVDYPYNGTTGANYIGEPAKNPYPWIAWNNRPFMNPMELLAVPAASPSRYFLETTPGFPTITAPPIPPAVPRSPFADTTDASVLQLPFGHMLNFFQTASITSVGRAPHFYRLLDFVEVPSPYAGAERWYNPTNFGGPLNGALTSPTDPFLSGTVPAAAASTAVFYRPPFNKLSRFRDPGRVNINTIFDADVWDSVVGQFPGLRAADNASGQVAAFFSRQGYPGTLLGMNNAYPTRFAHPFRGADSADLMPNVPTGPTGMRKVNGVEATLLRQHPTSNSQPLFTINAPDPAPINTQYNNWIGDPPTAAAANPAYVGAYHDITRNPYFAYQTYQKLGSVLTTRSNCFAVWVTIGYFEVEDYRPFTTGPMANQVIIDAAHPDGLALGQEVGADSGEIKRHRAFYIIDRSIPVGFIPGSRLNTDDCVLIRRLIE